jgi:hypothetical protein
MLQFIQDQQGLVPPTREFKTNVSTLQTIHNGIVYIARALFGIWQITCLKSDEEVGGLTVTRNTFQSQDTFASFIRGRYDVLKQK